MYDSPKGMLSLSQQVLIIAVRFRLSFHNEAPLVTLKDILKALSENYGGKDDKKPSS